MKKRHAAPTGGILRPLLALLVLALLALVVFRFHLTDLLAGSFDRFDRYNVAVGGGTLGLVSFEPRSKTIVFIRAPADLYISETAHGYGQYRLSAVYAAGELDKRGGETLAATMQEYIGVPVTGYLYTPKTFTDVKSFFVSPWAFLETKSNLPVLDRFRLSWSAWQTRFDHVETVDLARVAGPLILADGTSAQNLDAAELDNNLSGLFVETRAQAEDLRVEVINTTKTVGLGARAVRLLANIGLSVVNVDSVSVPLPKCEIQATEKALGSLTVARAAQIYGCTVTKKADAGRAQVSVLLGENYALNLLR